MFSPSATNRNSGSARGYALRARTASRRIRATRWRFETMAPPSHPGTAPGNDLYTPARTAVPLAHSQAEVTQPQRDMCADQRRHPVRSHATGIRTGSPRKRRRRITTYGRRKATPGPGEHAMTALEKSAAIDAAADGTCLPDVGEVGACFSAALPSRVTGQACTRVARLSPRCPAQRTTWPVPVSPRRWPPTCAIGLQRRPVMLRCHAIPEGVFRWPESCSHAPMGAIATPRPILGPPDLPGGDPQARPVGRLRREHGRGNAAGGGRVPSRRRQPRRPRTH